MEINKIRELISQMTLEEKAGLCSGKDNWYTKGVQRLGIPEVMVSDGPHGLRKQEGDTDHLGINESLSAVCFPAGCTTAASFDRKLLKKLGEAIGKECQAVNVQTILGPALNIKRSPLCGRNFEYLSEDPLVSSELSQAFVEGVQSQGVGTSMKHFLANNQEHRRMTSSSEVDERTLREIYLAAFEGAVKNAKPWTIMSSYNKINGTFVSENSKYLTDILRKEWGYDGMVVSDWGAVHDRVAAIKAGCELTMPSATDTDHVIVDAVKDGTLEEKFLDTACERILNFVYQGVENRKEDIEFDYERDHLLAKHAAEESMVLLKNEESILPLNKKDKIAFIGKFADKPRYQGGGSSHINSFKVTSALDAIKESPQYANLDIRYAQGYVDHKDLIDENLKEEAIQVAEEADLVVIFAGLPETFESEGYDRSHLNMPNCQNDLIDAVCEVQENVVVVLHNGAPVEMPWINKVKGVVEAYLGGQAVGSATVDILFGEVSPSGRLSETFPIKLEDNPSYLYYFGEGDLIEYREGVFVGYRYYETKKTDVLFPFGHGLSYTTFEYSNLNIDKKNMKDTEKLTVTVDVTNTGSVLAKEVVQLYVAPEKGMIIRPIRELKGFDKIALNPGETKRVTFTLDKRSFAYWNSRLHDWHVESGKYAIQIGKSAREILLEEEVELVSDTPMFNITYSFNTTIGDLVNHPKGREFWNKILPRLIGGLVASGIIDEEKLAGIGIEVDDKENLLEIMISKFVSEDKGEDGNNVFGMDVMMTLPINMLTGFIPDLEKKDLQKLLNEMNEA